ncbi:MAG: aspartate 1-decarboxylase [Bdellovibrionales bacterium]|nr:aspartate 1-decarboxylase [Bdellovibrionales bacterium]
MLKSKIHGAFVTEADVEYEGSIGIDQSLLELSGILPFEKVHVWNRSNGQRFETYTIVEPPKSGKISVNGAAALLVKPGDGLIIASFTWTDQNTASTLIPRIVLVDSRNIGKLKD